MPPRTFYQSAVAFCTIAITLAVLGAQLGAYHWAGDLLALGVDSWLWNALFALVAYVRARNWRWAALAMAALFLGGSQLASTTHAMTAPSAAARVAPDVRILVYNIYYQNPDLAAVVAEVKRHDPDVVFLMEYSYDVQQRIEASFVDYPYRLIQPSRFTMGLALFSRIPFDETEVHRAEATRIPVYQVRMRIDGRPFTLVGGHPWPPQPQWGQLHRDQMLEITRVAAGVSDPLIVAGDFNAAPWSFIMRQLGERAAVRQARPQFDLSKTWFLAPFVGLPLDHVLVSDAWQVLAHTYGAPGGSDHVPLVVDLCLRDG
jgi:endonuclease/exonuclease/phosphatase (EEP) superfamily protein YafD